LNDNNKKVLLQDILDIQRNAIITRFKASGCEKLIIGVSGGVDSSLALLNAVFVCDYLKISRKNIFGVTMPGLGTTQRTFDNACCLINLLEINSKKISIVKSCEQHFKDIDHDINDMSVVFENAQARMRTQILFDLGNKFNGLVLGTGDMTEEALGFTTYNGDHISNYNPNGNITKSNIRELINFIIIKQYFSQEINSCLRNILAGPVSPELLPKDNSGESSQKTEEIIGPAELNDFFVYYLLKYGYSREKIIFMAQRAFDKYTQEEIIKCFNLFHERFIAQQFKRSCANDGPQIFSFGFSPRGSFFMPSDINLKKN